MVVPRCRPAGWKPRATVPITGGGWGPRARVLGARPLGEGAGLSKGAQVLACAGAYTHVAWRGQRQETAVDVGQPAPLAASQASKRVKEMYIVYIYIELSKSLAWINSDQTSLSS